MTRFEKMKLMNIDEISIWLDKYGQFDTSPWIQWWDQCYCDKCESIIGRLPDFGNKECEFSWCEVEHKCKYFPDMSEVPENRDIIKMWLESEDE